MNRLTTTLAAAGMMLTGAFALTACESSPQAVRKPTAHQQAAKGEAHYEARQDASRGQATFAKADQPTSAGDQVARPSNELASGGGGTDARVNKSVAELRGPEKFVDQSRQPASNAARADSGSGDAAVYAMADAEKATDPHGAHAGMQMHGKADAMPVAKHENMWESVTKAVAVLHGTKGNEKVMGTVLFEQQGDKVKVTAHVEGLQPSSKHGFHVHEFGDCSAPDGTSAGGHYNPQAHEHGLPDEPMDSKHAGDMGNLEADDKGVAHYEMTFDNISIAGLMNPIIGRGLVVHAKPDDGGQPTGNAGDRIACGVIGVANSKTTLNK